MIKICLIVLRRADFKAEIYTCFTSQGEYKLLPYTFLHSCGWIQSTAVTALDLSLHHHCHTIFTQLAFQIQAMQKWLIFHVNGHGSGSEVLSPHTSAYPLQRFGFLQVVTNRKIFRQKPK